MLSRLSRPHEELVIIWNMARYDSHKHHRRTIRLSEWDYCAPALYFVTICTYQRQCLFAEPVYHEIVANALVKIPHQPHANHVILNEWIVMPNHIHMILDFRDAPKRPSTPIHATKLQNAPAGSLGVVVGRYKTAVTTRLNHLRQTPRANVWQRGYYERIIRNEQEWQATQNYIRNNPARWAEDRDNLDTLIPKMTRHP